MRQQRGKVVIPSGINVWPHELETAKTLAEQGHVVEFIPRSEGQHESSADVMMDDIAWEMKAPKASSLAAIERNIRRACRQLRHVILDVRRMRGIPAAALEREARSCVQRVRELEGLVLVGKGGSVVEHPLTCFYNCPRKRANGTAVPSSGAFFAPAQRRPVALSSKRAQTSRRPGARRAFCFPERVVLRCIPDCRCLLSIRCSVRLRFAVYRPR